MNFLSDLQGCAVIWSYIELFGQSLIKSCVFVDQAPLQNLSHDWQLGSKGCYDIASLTRMQCALEHDFPAFARGVAKLPILAHSISCNADRYPVRIPAGIDVASWTMVGINSVHALVGCRWL